MTKGAFLFLIREAPPLPSTTTTITTVTYNDASSSGIYVRHACYIIHKLNWSSPPPPFPIIHACIFVATVELVETALKIPTKLRGVCLSVIQSTGFFFKKHRLMKEFGLKGL